MKTTVYSKKQIVGLFYGLAAGFAFSIFAWGVDAVILTNANGAYPFVKFFPGLLISLLAGGLVGWLSARIQKSLIAIVLWLLFSLLLSWLLLWLPLRATPFLIGLSNNTLGNFLEYPFYQDFVQIQWFGFAGIAIISIICSLIENNLIDSAMFGTGKLSLGIPILISFICFSLAGNIADGLTNRLVRDPILAVDNLIQFSIDNADVDIPIETARKMHLGALKGVSQYISRDRSLILSNYDQSFGQVDILVNFDGYWVKCTTIYGQVTYCKEALNTPKSLISKQTILFAYQTKETLSHNGWFYPDNL